MILALRSNVYPARIHGFFPDLTGCRLVAVKVRDLIRMIEFDGWKHVRTTGSHRHFKHPAKPHVVTVPGSPGDDIPIGTLKAILRSAGLEEKK